MVKAAAKIDARHLFRALLRASTYLPDELAQTYIRSHIIDRFRNTAVITPRRLHNGRQALSTLQRAANGEQKCLLQVLNHTYGRIGKRRRELMNKVWLPADRPQSSSQTPSSTSESKSNQTNNENISSGNALDVTKEATAEPRGNDNLSRSRLHALLISQSRNHPPGSPRRRIRQIKPTIPQESQWGRPLPLSRQKNIVSRFWADTLDRVLPPMPERYWNRLRDLSTGVIPFEGPPTRRPRAQSLAQATHWTEAPMSGESKLNPTHLKLPIRQSEQDRSIVYERNRNKFTPRIMRRLWSAVWNSSPLMVHHEGKSQWQLKWGGSRSAGSKGEFAVAVETDLELFEGLEGKDAVVCGSVDDTQLAPGKGDVKFN